MQKKETYLKVVDELLDLMEEKPLLPAIMSNVYFGVITLIENLYGKNDIRSSNLSKFKTEKYDKDYGYLNIHESFKGSLLGILNSMKTDIDNDLIFNVESTISPENTYMR